MIGKGVIPAGQGQQSIVIEFNDRRLPQYPTPHRVFLAFQYLPVLVLNLKFDGEMPIRIAGRQLMSGTRIDHGEGDLNLVTWLGNRRRGLDLKRDRPAYHVGIMPTAPQMASTLSNRPAVCHGPLHFRHVTALTDKSSVLQEIAAFSLGIGAAWAYFIELPSPRDDIVAAVADLGRPESRIKFRGMGCHGVIKGPQDHTIPDMARRAGHAFFLIGRIVMRVDL